MTKMIEPVHPHDFEVIEPYQTCSLEEGMASTDLFSPRTVQSIHKFVLRIRPRMNARRNNTFPCSSSENFIEPIKYYKAINGDGLISVCMKVHDKGGRHEIATYDHVTEQLKQVGSIPRHHFKKSVDVYVVCLNDPQFVEGVIGAMTQDAQYCVIFAHSKNLRVVNVFDIPNSVCLSEEDFSGGKFFEGCQPTGIALVPTGASKSEFQIALLSGGISSDSTEVRVWNTGTKVGRVVKLQDIVGGIVVSSYIIDPRKSALKFSPDGHWLCVLAYVLSVKEHYCLLMDAVTLKPCFRMPHNFAYPELCCIFPLFSGSHLLMFVHNTGDYNNVDDYQLLFFQIPQTLRPLKELCRWSILRAVDRSNLDKLPVPQNLISFLSGTYQDTVLVDAKEQCTLV